MGLRLIPNEMSLAIGFYLCRHESPARARHPSRICSFCGSGAFSPEGGTGSGFISGQDVDHALSRGDGFEQRE